MVGILTVKEISSLATVNYLQKKKFWTTKVAKITAWFSDSRSSRNSPLFLLHPSFRYHLHKSVPWKPILSQRIKSTQPQVLPLRFSLILCCNRRLDLQTSLCHPDFPPKTLHALLIHSMRATCSAHVIQLRLMTKIRCLVKSDNCKANKQVNK